MTKITLTSNQDKIDLIIRPRIIGTACSEHNPRWYNPFTWSVPDDIGHLYYMVIDESYGDSHVFLVSNELINDVFRIKP